MRSSFIIILILIVFIFSYGNNNNNLAAGVNAAEHVYTCDSKAATSIIVNGKDFNYNSVTINGTCLPGTRITFSFVRNIEKILINATLNNVLVLVLAVTCATNKTEEQIVSTYFTEKNGTVYSPFGYCLRFLGEISNNSRISIRNVKAPSVHQKYPYFSVVRFSAPIVNSSGIEITDAFLNYSYVQKNNTSSNSNISSPENFDARVAIVDFYSSNRSTVTNVTSIVMNKLHLVVGKYSVPASQQSYSVRAYLVMVASKIENVSEFKIQGSRLQIEDEISGYEVLVSIIKFTSESGMIKYCPLFSVINTDVTVNRTSTSGGKNLIYAITFHQLEKVQLVQIENISQSVYSCVGEDDGSCYNVLAIFDGKSLSSSSSYMFSNLSLKNNWIEFNSSITEAIFYASLVVIPSRVQRLSNFSQISCVNNTVKTRNCLSSKYQIVSLFYSYVPLENFRTFYAENNFLESKMMISSNSYVSCNMFRFGSTVHNVSSSMLFLNNYHEYHNITSRTGTYFYQVRLGKKLLSCLNLVLNNSFTIVRDVSSSKGVLIIQSLSAQEEFQVTNSVFMSNIHVTGEALEAASTLYVISFRVRTMFSGTSFVFTNASIHIGRYVRSFQKQLQINCALATHITFSSSSFEENSPSLEITNTFINVSETMYGFTQAFVTNIYIKEIASVRLINIENHHFVFDKVYSRAGNAVVTVVYVGGVRGIFSSDAYQTSNGGKLPYFFTETIANLSVTFTGYVYSHSYKSEVFCLQRKRKTYSSSSTYEGGIYNYSDFSLLGVKGSRVISQGSGSILGILISYISSSVSTFTSQHLFINNIIVDIDYAHTTQRSVTIAAIYSLRPITFFSASKYFNYHFNVTNTAVYVNTLSSESPSGGVRVANVDIAGIIGGNFFGKNLLVNVSVVDVVVQASLYIVRNYRSIKDCLSLVREFSIVNASFISSDYARSVSGSVNIYSIMFTTVSTTKVLSLKNIFISAKNFTSIQSVARVQFLVLTGFYDSIEYFFVEDVVVNVRNLSATQAAAAVNLISQNSDLSVEKQIYVRNISFLVGTIFCALDAEFSLYSNYFDRVWYDISDFYIKDVNFVVETIWTSSSSSSQEEKRGNITMSLFKLALPKVSLLADSSPRYYHGLQLKNITNVSIKNIKFQVLNSLQSENGQVKVILLDFGGAILDHSKFLLLENAEIETQEISAAEGNFLSIGLMAQYNCSGCRADQNSGFQFVTIKSCQILFSSSSSSSYNNNRLSNNHPFTILSALSFDNEAKTTSSFLIENTSVSENFAFVAYYSNSFAFLNNNNNNTNENKVTFVFSGGETKFLVLREKEKEGNSRIGIIRDNLQEQSVVASSSSSKSAFFNIRCSAGFQKSEIKQFYRETNDLVGGIIDDCPSNTNTKSISPTKTSSFQFHRNVTKTKSNSLSSSSSSLVSQEKEKQSATITLFDGKKTKTTATATQQEFLLRSGSKSSSISRTKSSSFENQDHLVSFSSSVSKNLLLSQTKTHHQHNTSNDTNLRSSHSVSVTTRSNPENNRNNNNNKTTKTTSQSLSEINNNNTDNSSFQQQQFHFVGFSAKQRQEARSASSGVSLVVASLASPIAAFEMSRGISLSVLADCVANSNTNNNNNNQEKGEEKQQNSSKKKSSSSFAWSRKRTTFPETLLPSVGFGDEEGFYLRSTFLGWFGLIVVVGLLSLLKRPVSPVIAMTGRVFGFVSASMIIPGGTLIAASTTTTKFSDYALVIIPLLLILFFFGKVAYSFHQKMKSTKNDDVAQKETSSTSSLEKEENCNFFLTLSKIEFNEKKTLNELLIERKNLLLFEKSKKRRREIEEDENENEENENDAESPSSLVLKKLDEEIDKLKKQTQNISTFRIKLKQFLESDKGRYFFIGDWLWTIISGEENKIKQQQEYEQQQHERNRILVFSNDDDDDDYHKNKNNISQKNQQLLQKYGIVVTRFIGIPLRKASKVSEQRNIPLPWSEKFVSVTPHFFFYNAILTTLTCLFAGISLSCSNCCNTMIYLSMLVNSIDLFLVILLQPYIVRSQNLISIFSSTVLLTGNILTMVAASSNKNQNQQHDSESLQTLVSTIQYISVYGLMCVAVFRMVLISTKILLMNLAGLSLVSFDFEANNDYDYDDNDDEGNEKSEEQDSLESPLLSPVAAESNSNRRTRRRGSSITKMKEQQQEEEEMFLTEEQKELSEEMKSMRSLIERKKRSEWRESKKNFSLLDSLIDNDDNDNSNNNSNSNSNSKRNISMDEI